MRHLWVGDATLPPAFAIEWNILCFRNKGDEPTLGGERRIEVTLVRENVNCRECLRLMDIDLVITTTYPDSGVAVHIDNNQLGGLWLKVKNGEEVATIFLTNDEASELSNNLDLRARRREM